jgi:cytochrome oxidase Cu insertion factor (SCO1/SenC/PrrC family)
MRRRTAIQMLGTLALLGPTAGTSLFAQGEKKEAPKMALIVGDEAPDFTLPDDKGGQVKLSSFRGKKNVALAFYVFAFTGG